MFTATLDANNQITLPMEIRKQLRIRPGDKVQFVPSETGEVLLRNGSARALQRAQAAFAGAAEAMGLKSEEDVQALVDEVRYGTSRGSAVWNFTGMEIDSLVAYRKAYNDTV